jgi:NDP-sugar pyrophosphorylase family protein
MIDIKTLVLCAGKSTRITSIGKGIPKPLIDLGGKSVLQQNLHWLSQAGIREIWINLHYRPDDIRAHLTGMQVQYIYEPEILGTAGAIKNLCKEWTETFLVIYGDNLFNFSLDEFYLFHKKNKALATIALFDRERNLNTGMAGGQVVLRGSRIESFIEGSAEKISPYVNAGAYFLEPEILNYIPSGVAYDFGKELFPQLIAKEVPICSYLIDGYCLAIDTPESYHRATQLLEKL